MLKIHFCVFSLLLDTLKIDHFDTTPLSLSRLFRFSLCLACCLLALSNWEMVSLSRRRNKNKKAAADKTKMCYFVSFGAADVIKVQSLDCWETFDDGLR